MKGAVIAMILVVGAACGAYHYPGATGGTGTVTGSVIVVPCGPVQPADKACAGRFAGMELDFTSGATTAATTTDANGNFTIELAVGTWNVSVVKFTRIVSGPRTITVHAGDSIVANYVVDSGIRVPVAAG
jgi:hypothetical protein